MDIGKARDIQNPTASWPDTAWLHRLHETNKMEDVSNTKTERTRGRLSNVHWYRIII